MKKYIFIAAIALISTNICAQTTTPAYAALNERTRAYVDRLQRILPQILQNEAEGTMFVTKTRSLTFLNTLADLQAAAVDTTQIVLLLGKTVPGDSQGGFYMWDLASTSAVDNTYLNTVTSNAIGTSGPGRWIRIFQRVRVYPQGILVTNGIKIMYIFGNTDASGNVTVNLTAENTTNGTALFTEIWSGRGGGTVQTAPTSMTVMYGAPVSIGTGFKTITFNFQTANPTTLGGTLLSIVGLVITPLKAPPTNTAVTVVVDGV